MEVDLEGEQLITHGRPHPECSQRHLGFLLPTVLADNHQLYDVFYLMAR